MSWINQKTIESERITYKLRFVFIDFSKLLSPSRNVAFCHKTSTFSTLKWSHGITKLNFIKV